MAKGVMVVQANPLSPDMEDAFNAWYRDVHIPEVLAAPGFVGVRRFKIHPDDAASRDADRAQYLIVYDIEADDIFGAIREMRRRRKDSPPDAVRDTVLRADPPAVVTVYDEID